MSSTAAMDVVALRGELPILDETIYLNAGTFGPLPRAALQAMQDELQREATARFGSAYWTQLVEIHDRARSVIARLCGATPAQVALAHATHEALGSMLDAMDLSSDDVILSTDEEHFSVHASLRHLRERRGITVQMAHFPGSEESIRMMAAAVGPSTTAIVLSHVSYLSGAVVDLAALVTACRERAPNVVIIVDGAQGAGAVDVSVADGWDAYTVSGQKWVLGPAATGALVVADPERWNPRTASWAAFSDFSDPASSRMSSTALRFEAGTISTVPWAGFAAATEFCLAHTVTDASRARVRELNVFARNALASWIADHGLPRPRGDNHLLSFDVPEPDSAANLVTSIAASGIDIRDLPGGLLRISIGPWTLESELTRLAEVLSSGH